MGKRKRKNRSQIDPNKVILLATVLIQLVNAIIDMIETLIE